MDNFCGMPKWPHTIKTIAKNFAISAHKMRFFGILSSSFAFD